MCMSNPKYCVGVTMYKYLNKQLQLSNFSNNIIRHTYIAGCYLNEDLKNGKFETFESFNYNAD